MSSKVLNRIVAGIVFLISLIQYVSTVQPSVSFWDCGEFIAAAFSLQVPHPPGAPMFLIVGRLFSMIPFGENIAFRVNMASVLSSALTVLFVYLTAVKLIENYKKTFKNLIDALFVYIAAAIGALSLSLSDTFWFNGVEAEVYAASTFLFAFIVWLIMIWNEKADAKDNEKYLIMIAFLIGLSIGVHLMAVLAIVPVVMIIMFRKYVNDDEACLKTGYIFLIHAAILLIVAIGMWASEKTASAPNYEEYKAFDKKFLMVMAGISVLIMGAFWKKIFTKNSIYLPMIFGGIALMITYPGVVKILPGLVVAIGADSITADLIVIFSVLAIALYLIYWSVKNQKATLNLIFTSFLFIMLGFSAYSMVIIRSNQQPPMNENEPNDFSELVSYLNREQYGDFPTFKRRFSNEPHQQRIYTAYKSDLDFLWTYQMNHMFNRYLMWNYVGRESWAQDAKEDWSKLYGIPLLLGLIGLYYHYRKDWKMASAFLVMFIFMGYLTAFYQNQQQPQPRERDYFYVGAFFVYSIWVALGVYGLAEYIMTKLKKESLKNAAVFGALGFFILTVPVNMFVKNYNEHDRSKSWFPWDYSYNILQSCAPNAILFTYGDNDTFPLWYLQDVEGVRRDIRIVNLSLLQTPWYMKQQKYLEPYGASKVPMSLTDEMMEQIATRPTKWDGRATTLPVPESVYKEFGVTDTAIVNSGKISWVMPPSARVGDYKLIISSDLAARDIVLSTRWTRPIYFSTTVGPHNRIGLNDYLRLEGMAYRLVPFKGPGDLPFVEPEIMKKQFLDINKEPQKDYAPGFLFRGFDDPSIFWDAMHLSYWQNYRTLYYQLALHFKYVENNKEEAIAVLDAMLKNISIEIFDIDLSLLYQTSRMYYEAGNLEKYKELGKYIEEKANAQIKADPTGQNFERYFNPYRLLLEFYENTKEYNKSLEVYRKLQTVYPNDPNLIREIERLTKLISESESKVENKN